MIVDALFGTGFSGEPRADAAALIDRINASGARVFVATGSVRGGLGAPVLLSARGAQDDYAYMPVTTRVISWGGAIDYGTEDETLQNARTPELADFSIKVLAKYQL